ncbi:MAG: copper amine oxidase N-terminal domain-containing protein, partial [Clostridia bacterium]|nr:copper amine oxidase N-terminal domain-containing protein [Clostridia bacterium]
GNSIWSHCEHWNGTMNYLNCTKEIELTHGDYFISIEGVRVGYAGNFYGKYSFSLSDGGKIIDAPIPDPNPGIKVLVNGVPVQFDQPPVLENGRTLVPLRAIFEALGANVGWDDATQTVTATKNGIQISLQIGSTQMYVNGNVKTLDVPAKLINSRTLVPVRAVSEAFGCKVDWINDTQTGVITQ